MKFWGLLKKIIQNFLDKKYWNMVKNEILLIVWKNCTIDELYAVHTSQFCALSETQSKSVKHTYMINILLKIMITINNQTYKRSLVKNRLFGRIMK